MADKARSAFVHAFGYVLMEPRGTKKTLAQVKTQLFELIKRNGAPFKRREISPVLDGLAHLDMRHATSLADYIDRQMCDLPVHSIAAEAGLLEALNPFVLTEAREGTLQCLERDHKIAQGLDTLDSPRIRFFQAWCRLNYPLETNRAEIDWESLLVKFGHSVDIPSRQIRLIVYGVAPLDPAKLNRLISIARDRCRTSLPPEINPAVFA